MDILNEKDNEGDVVKACLLEWTDAGLNLSNACFDLLPQDIPLLQTLQARLAPLPSGPCTAGQSCPTDPQGANTRRSTAVSNASKPCCSERDSEVLRLGSRHRQVRESSRSVNSDLK